MNTPILFLKSRPTPAQAEAGNYRKPKVRFQGLEIAIENPAGSVREGVDDSGKKWRTKMRNSYGYVKRSTGKDGDHVDVFLGPNPDATHAYVIRQLRPPSFTRPDEDKAVLGADSEAEARRIYLAHYDDPRFLGRIIAMPMDEFKRKVRATFEKPGLIKCLLLFKSTRREDRYPKPGERIEFRSDRFTDKGPSAGTITDTKATVDGLMVRIRHSDEERWFSWEDLLPHAKRGKRAWLID